MNEGKLVPDQLMIDLVMTDATPYLEEGRSLLLDGFPRTLPQAKALDQIVNVDLVVNLDVPTETIVERIADRYEGQCSAATMMTRCAFWNVHRSILSCCIVSKQCCSYNHLSVPPPSR